MIKTGSGIQTRGASKRGAVAARAKNVLAAVTVLATFSVSAMCGNKPTYQTGKLLKIGVQDVKAPASTGQVLQLPIGGVVGRAYVFEIELDNLTYFVEYFDERVSYKPDWAVNDPIELRLEKGNRMLLKRPNGKELEVVVLKRVRRP